MSSPGSAEREITQAERHQFIDAVETLDPFMREWPPGLEDTPEKLFGPADEWSDEFKAELQDERERVGYSRFALFRISSVVTLIVGKSDFGAMVEESEAALLRGRHNWTVTSLETEVTPHVSTLTVRNHEVGKPTHLPYTARFKEVAMVRSGDGPFEGFISEDEVEARAIADEAIEDANRDIWDLSFMSELIKIWEQQREQAQELEELTGIIPTLFTKRRFDNIMAQLEVANSQNFEPTL